MAKVKAPLPVATTVVDGERDTEALLTYSQERFAVRYAQTRDPAQSYFYAYDCREDVKPHTLRAAGWELLQNPAVIRRVKQLTKASSLAVDFGIPDVMRVWYEMATADPNELVSYRVGCCRYCRGVGHAYQWREREYLDALAKVERANSLLADARLYEPLPDPSGGLDFNHTLPPVDDCPECHGEGVGRMVACDTTKLSAGARLLYGGVRQKRGGETEIIIADQVKAWENFTRMLGGWDDKVRLDGTLTLAAKAVDLRNVSPQEAAKAYEEVVRHMAISPRAGGTLVT